MLDILIKNGTVIDGTGGPAKNLDVGIAHGRITMLEPKITKEATQVIDATGLYVAPGFIDIQNHSDSYWTLLDQPEQASMLAQGATTIIVGHCGSSLAPLASREAIKAVQKWHTLAGANINWASMDDYLGQLRARTIGVNVGTLVGHATLRRGLLGDAIRPATAEEINVMSRLLDESLEAGALGLSLGLMYAHEVDSSRDELVALASRLKPQNKFLSVHLRSEGAQILDAVDEAIELGKLTGVGIKISHIKIRGMHNWQMFGQMMNKLESAYHQGLKIAFDVYPYDSTWNVLYTYLPKWAYEGGREQILKHLKDPQSRRKILDHLNSQLLSFDKIIISHSFGNNAFVGKNLMEVAANQSVSPAEALLNVLAATNTQVIAFDHNLSGEYVDLFLSSPLSMVATDGVGYSLKNKDGFVHPRCFGTFPRFLRLVREKKMMKWEEAIRKITGEPANWLGFADRGVIARNNFADVTVFNPATVTDYADYVNPDILPDGIECVVVNGKIAYKPKQLLGLEGKVLTH